MKSEFSKKKKLNLETDVYSIENFYNYWQNNSATIESDLEHQFKVKK